VVVTPVSDCPSERCVELAAEGTRVIILAAIPRESERDRYLEAGAAAYVAMTVGGDQLIGEIRRVLGQPPDGA
jgi:DNA-binding NarL/FixJ family response regulator